MVFTFHVDAPVVCKINFINWSFDIACLPLVSFCKDCLLTFCTKFGFKINKLTRFKFSHILGREIFSVQQQRLGEQQLGQWRHRRGVRLQERIHRIRWLQQLGQRRCQLGRWQQLGQQQRWFLQQQLGQQRFVQLNGFGCRYGSCRLDGSDGSWLVNMGVFSNWDCLVCNLWGNFSESFSGLCGVGKVSSQSVVGDGSGIMSWGTDEGLASYEWSTYKRSTSKWSYYASIGGGNKGSDNSDKGVHFG